VCEGAGAILPLPSEAPRSNGPRAVGAQEEIRLSRPTVSFAKRQREQIKRDKQAEKAAKRQQRKTDKENGVLTDENEFAVLDGPQPLED
jgi:hypothetical protein